MQLDQQHTEQARRFEDDLRTLGTRFDRHLEIYAQNGKELAALKTEVSNLIGVVNDLKGSIDTASRLHVSRREFNTVRTVVFGAVALILTAFFGALTNLII